MPHGFRIRALFVAALAWGTLAQAQQQTLQRLHQPIPSPGLLNGYGSVVGDVDGDGDGDLVVGSTLVLPDGARRRVLLNDGNGAFQELPDAAAPWIVTWTSSLALTDLDLDGDLDLIEGNNGQNGLYLNDGTGRFIDFTWQLPVHLDETSEVGVIDADGDGDFDLLFANWDQPSRLVINQGGGSYVDAPGGVLADPEMTSDVAIGDVDGDGDEDVLFAAYSDGSASPRLAINQGGTFVEAPFVLPLSIGDGRAILLDVDQDGDLDAFVGGASDSVVMLNDGTGAFTAGAVLPPHPSAGPNDFMQSLAFGDIDGDSDLDVMAAYTGSAGAMDALLFRNDGTGAFAVSPVASQQLATFGARIHLTDVDGDSDLDVIADEQRLGLNHGDGAFELVDGINGEGADFFWFNGDGDFARLVTLGDANNDGAPDLFGAGRVLINRDGTFDADPAGVLVAPDAGQVVAVDDLDLDGNADVLFGQSVFLGDGTGAFADVTSAWMPTLGFLKTTEADFGDVTGDGFPDLWLASLHSQDVRYLQSSVGVAFADFTSFQEIPNWISEQVLVDIDQDGDLDLVTASEIENQVFVNGGIGLVTEGVGSLPAAIPCLSVDAGDWDADGDVDLAYGTAGPNGDLLFENVGAGTFADVTGFQLPLAVSTSVVRLADLDGDDDLDLYMAHDGGGEVYRNDGAGLFSTTANMLPHLEHISDATVADVDNDGDVDLIAAGWGGVLRNVTRQIAWRAVPRIGKPLDMDVYGTALQPWFLGASVGKTSLLMPDFGELGINPHTMILAVGGVLDAQGRATASFAVPATLPLVGASAYWQGLVGSPQLMFTNVERTTFTDL